MLLELRERRSRFGRVVKWAFWLFHLGMLLLSLGTCAAVGPYLAVPDPEVALGAGMFGAMTLATLWAVWPAGSLVLLVLLLATRGRKRLIPAAALAQPQDGPVPGPLGAGSVTPGPAIPAPPPRGSVPPTGGRAPPGA